MEEVHQPDAPSVQNTRKPEFRKGRQKAKKKKKTTFKNKLSVCNITTTQDNDPPAPPPPTRSLRVPPDHARDLPIESQPPNPGPLSPHT